MANSAVLEFRGRGITEQDVWQAADALLLEGARPTIERVRQKIGRGSPNTVSPYLDAWFGKLGTRIKDPMAFSAPPAVPDPVQQAAVHFWEVAQAQARADFDERLQAGLADAVANVEAEKERANIAEASAYDASAKATHLQTEVGQLHAALEEQRAARVQADERLAEARRVIDEMRRRLDQALAEILEVRKSSERAIAEAIDRFAAAERRAALEIDNERVARNRAERHAAGLERRLETTQSEAQAAEIRHMQKESQQQAALDHATGESVRVEARAAKLQVRVDEQRDLLAQTRAETQAAKAEAALATRMLSALRPSAKGAVRAKRARNRAA